ncbi:MAG: ketopantoate reductase family protein [Anaerolineae bacterium]|nr:ketopantoate reductase family protein [Anaerolineae bacterium]
MTENPNVAILGAGALGAMYAASFYDAGIPVGFIARGDRYNRLKAGGLVINEKAYTIPVYDPDHAPGPADLIIVALKDQHLRGAAADLAPFVGAETQIISVMNGLGSEEVIGEAVGPDRVLYCIALGMDAVREDSAISYAHVGKLVFGEARNDSISGRVRRVQAILDRAGLAHETPPDMIKMLWWKFMINVGMNQLTGALGAPYGVVQTSPDAQALMEALMGEVIALAQAVGVDLSEQDIQNWYPVMNSLSPDGKTSLLQDIEAGRKTEVGIFGGKVLELGREYGIDTPVNETFYRIVRVLEGG